MNPTTPSFTLDSVLAQARVLIRRPEEVEHVFRFQAEREARGWSRSEVARRARMNNADISRIESGRLVPYPTQLAKLAAALGWPAGEAERLLEEVQ